MELLKKLYEIHSKSGREKRIKKFIRRWVNENVPEAIVSYDAMGNLYFVKGTSGTFPVVVAHLDQVQNSHSRDFQALVAGDIIIGYSNKSKAQQGLGADDKNGVWIALQCLLKYDVIKVAFFVSEEVGCIGSGAADMTFFEDARFVLQCDRRGAKDLITEAGWTDLCSRDFVNAIKPEQFGYKEESGMLTDVLTLKENGLKVSCINMSCGYYKPHTDCEFTNIPDLMNCLSFVEHIIETCTDVYPHEYAYTLSHYDKYYDDNWNKSKRSDDIELALNESFKDLYREVIEKILQEYPYADFDTVLWFLKESYPDTYFWEDWTRSLYYEVKASMLEDKYVVCG